MESRTFDTFRQLIYERSGITLGPGKESLVSARIGKRMRALEIDEPRAYLQYVVSDRTGEEVVHLIDAISTNVTSFFREAAHFDLISELLAKWHDEGQRRFRFWSAASSTGEEPYSLAICIQEVLGGSGADVRILATDISTKVLRQCVEGVYSPEKVAPIPRAVCDRYFDVRRDSKGVSYVAKEELKRMVVFKRLNLSQPPFPMKGPLDIVMCRNVMIYFDTTIRRQLLQEAHRLLKPGGYLMVGHAESLTGMISSFKMVKPSVYRKD